jgi:5'-methylthioadenosine phosphorylase
MTHALLGIVGGSGFYDLPGLKKIEELSIDSPWGDASDQLRRGEIEGKQVVFLARHGRGHRVPPSDINYRANIDCLKRAGVTDLVSLSACGSFREALAPRTFVLVDQFIDRTFRRATSFFGSGCVAHVSMAYPVGPRLVDRIAAAATAERIPHKRGGTYVCIEGPQFSTKAESLAFQAEGWSVIGMTNMPEAKLAREAEITYSTVAMVTDYDCWHDEHGPADVSSILKVMKENSADAARLVVRLARDFPTERDSCPIGSDRALDFAIVTPVEFRDPVLMSKLGAVAGRVLNK